MEARWACKNYEEALAVALSDFQTLDEIQVATLSGLLAGYYSYYNEDPVKNLKAECQFSIPLDGSLTFSADGKIDGLGTLTDGRSVLLEHKTTRDSVEPSSDYWMRLRFNPQIYQYVHAARANGWPIEVVYYDVTRKPLIRQKQTETPEDFCNRLSADAVHRPEFYFARREVPILDDDLEEFVAQRLEIGRDILSKRKNQKRWPGQEHRAWPRNCSEMQCGFCDFSGPCLQNITVDPAHPPAGFVVGDQNPELAAV
jgi:hypothetical protein